jgi:hypothetical protein
MNFQEFCVEAEEIDKQSISTNNSFVIGFSKSGGSAFSVDPHDIISFLKFLSANHKLCKETIEGDSSFEIGNAYINYKEGPYRALYKLISSESGLERIGTLGRSQTFGLTGVIVKFICYLSGQEYVKTKTNTFFDKVSVDKALANVPPNINDLAATKSIGHSVPSRKEQFKSWLKKEGLSQKTILSYADTSISLADKLLTSNNQITISLYRLDISENLTEANAWLINNSDWQGKNSSGNNMYQSGFNKYLEFLSSIMNVVSIPKPFILLAGISGTGKTRFVREQALSHNVGDINFCQIPVRPDWHEPSDLLGYISRITGTKYIATKALKFMIEAWREVAPNANNEGLGELKLSAPPYWLCLDEMNLAPVEQYFADYLSVLESRKFKDGEYSCEPLLDKSIFTMGCADIRADLGVKPDDDGLWEYFVNHGISLPPNLIVAGTVNMDETTHGFSRKVIDRAFTLDFGEFFPNDYKKFFAEQDVPKLFSYSELTHASQSDLASSVDADGTKTVNFLESINEVLRNTPFELAYRALNELLLHVACFNPQSEMALQSVWDDFLMTKILPRIDGDEDKLRVLRPSGPENLFDVLSEVIESSLSDIWSIEKSRIDLFRETHDGKQINNISCRSRKKLEWMKNRLEANTFTSFWP